MNLSEIRNCFPHTDHTIYLNHAATAPLSRQVLNAMNEYLQQRHATKIENYEEIQPVITETKEQLARLLNTTVACVEFMPNTSYGLNVLAQGIDWQPGDRIAVPGCEFPANVYPFLNLKRHGVEVDFIPHRDATFSINDIEDKLTSRTRLLTLSWVQFLSGFRTNLEDVGQLCHDRGIIFCVDAIQGLGALQLDVAACHIDFLACGGHKWMMAPQGIGYIYVNPSLQEQLAPMAGWLHGPVDWDNFFDYKLTFYPHAERYRVGMLNHLGIFGLHAALKVHFEAGISWCEEQVLDRASMLAHGLDAQGHARYGSSDPSHASGIVTLRHPDPEGLYAHLSARKIVASLRNRLVRFAPTYYNSPEEIQQTLDAVAAF